ADGDAWCVGVDQEHRRASTLPGLARSAGHGDEDRRAVGAADEPLSTVEAPPPSCPLRTGVQRRRVRACAGCWLGHREGRPDGTADKWRQIACLLLCG